MDAVDRERRGLFGGLKVPFSVSALIVAALGLLAFWLGEIFLGFLMEKDLLFEKFFTQALDLSTTFRGVLLTLFPMLKHGSGGFYLVGLAPAERLSRLDMLLFGAFLVLLWSFFGAAICRIAAMKLARDEGLEWQKALDFARRKWLQNFLSVVFVLAFMVFFYGIANGVVAGWIGRLLAGWGGVSLVAVGFPLVLASTFVALLLLYLLALGFNLIAAAIATESSDAFDGVSRSFSYVYSRPWQVILYHALTILFVGVFLWFAHWFVHGSLASVGGHGVRYLGITGEPAVVAGGDPTLPVRHQTDPAALSPWYRVVWLCTSAETTRGQKWQKFVESKPGTDYVIGGAVLYVIFLGVKLLVWSYVVAYFFNAGTTMYFLLRHDVDGEDFTEIFIEEEEEEQAFETLGPAGEAAAASAAGPAPEPVGPPVASDPGIATATPPAHPASGPEGQPRA